MRQFMNNTVCVKNHLDKIENINIQLTSTQQKKDKKLN